MLQQYCGVGFKFLNWSSVGKMRKHCGITRYQSNGYIQISNLICRGVLRAIPITFCPCRWLTYWYTCCWTWCCSSACFYQYRIWIQTSTTIYRKHQLGFIRAVSWSAQNPESHWSHMHITLTVVRVSLLHSYSNTSTFMHFIRSVGYGAVWCLVQLAQRYKGDKYFFPFFENATNLFNAAGHHACSPTLLKSLLISSYQHQKHLA